MLVQKEYVEMRVTVSFAYIIMNGESKNTIRRQNHHSDSRDIVQCVWFVVNFDVNTQIEL